MTALGNLNTFEEKNLESYLEATKSQIWHMGEPCLFNSLGTTYPQMDISDGESKYKPTHLWSISLWSKDQEHIMGKCSLFSQNHRGTG